MTITLRQRQRARYPREALAGTAEIVASRPPVACHKPGPDDSLGDAARKRVLETQRAGGSFSDALRAIDATSVGLVHAAMFVWIERWPRIRSHKGGPPPEVIDARCAEIRRLKSEGLDYLAACAGARERDYRTCAASEAHALAAGKAETPSPMSYEERLRAPVAQAGLPVRACNALESIGVFTVEDALRLTPAEVLAIPHVGPGTATHIRHCMRTFLGMDAHEAKEGHHEPTTQQPLARAG